MIAEVLYDCLVEDFGGAFFKSVTIHFAYLTSHSSSTGELMRWITLSCHDPHPPGFLYMSLFP